MSRANGFIKLDRALWQSEDWRALSVNARVLLLDIWCGYTGKNNGAIRYGLGHAVKCLGCGKSTAGRALRELQGSGFIEAVKRASFDCKSGARKREATTWRLTFLPTKQQRR